MTAEAAFAKAPGAGRFRENFRETPREHRICAHGLEAGDSPGHARRLAKPPLTRPARVQIQVRLLLFERELHRSRRHLLRHPVNVSPRRVIEL